MDASHFFTRWLSVWPHAAPLFELVNNIVRLSHKLTIEMLASCTDGQLYIGMGVYGSQLSVVQILEFLLVSFHLKIALNSDLVLRDDEETCDTPWRSFGSPTSCYLQGPHSMTWGDAWQFCAKSGGFMLEIESEEEHSKLTGKNVIFWRQNL